MHTAAAREWRYQLILNRDLRTPAARSDIARRAVRGEFVRVTRGAFLPASLWHDAGPDERFRMRVKAVAALASEDLVLSHASAAALWGLPWVGPWPDRIDALASRAYGGHSTRTVCRHLPTTDSEPVMIDGLLVTGLACTVVDLARSRGFTRAVVVGDASLNGATRAELAAPAALDADRLLEELERSRTGYASSRARDVLEFLDARSGSPGESVSRVSMWRAGLPAPVLQQSFSPWFVDSWWPDYGVIGEFDGESKYRDPQLRGRRSPAQVVIDEKTREDELRRRSRGFARWGWDLARSPAALAGRLRRGGLPAH
ncbi:MAG: hypothetical protein ABIS08_01060 [Pseudolysinimonas sp.]